MEKVKTRSYPLDFLKIIATIFIVFHHFQQNTKVYYEGWINYWGGWFEFGYMVEFFFVLSGYFMYRYVSKIQNGELTLAKWVTIRAKRLLPMVAITAVAYEISIFVYRRITGMTWAIFGELSIWGTVITALGIQESWGFPNPGVNNPVWYISVLLACYVIFYILCALSKKLQCSPLYFFVAMVLFGVGIHTFGINKPFQTWQMARGYFSFFFGVLLAAFVARNVISKKLTAASIAVLVGAGILFYHKEYALREPYVYILTFLVFPALILLCETVTAKKIFRHKVWGTVGSITFHVYLWHSPMFPLMYCLLPLMGITLNFSARWTMYLFLLVAFVIGTLSFFFIEKPINRLLDKKK